MVMPLRYDRPLTFSEHCSVMWKLTLIRCLVRAGPSRTSPPGPAPDAAVWSAYDHSMGTEVSTFLSAFEGADRAALERVYSIAREVVPEAEEGTSYAMAALLYRGKGLIATVRAKKFLAIYPYSGSVIAANLDGLAEFETTSGSIHYSAEHQLPDAVLRRVVQARRAEIDARLTHSAG